MKNVHKKTATITDIARQAGVSISTVSRVLNGTTPVTSDKLAAVQAAINNLQYRPNIAAQGLVRGRAMAVGVVTQDIASPFYGLLLSGIEHGLRGSNYHPVFANANWNPQTEAEAFDLILGRRVDGLIVLGGNYPDKELHELAERMPVVAVGRSIKGMEERCLRLDNFQGAYVATNHLLELGHNRIVHIGGIPTHADAIDRRNGYCQALRDHGVEIDERLIVEGNFQENSGLLALEVLLTRGAVFTAMFVANDQMAAGVRLGLYRRGIRVPQDVSLVGFDDQPGSAYSIPPLTTVHQPNFAMGQAAAHSILSLLKGEEPVLPSFSVELIIRESTLRLR